MEMNARTIDHIDHIDHITRRHFVRVGATPVMEVRVTYPILTLGEAEGQGGPSASAVERFNEAYRTMAEAFFDYFTASSSGPAEAAREAARAAGPTAAYTFDRRIVTLCMTATLTGEVLSVYREATRSSRRGSVVPLHVAGEDRWRVEDLSLMDFVKK